MAHDPHGRKQVDLFRLPRWMQLVIALATIALVVGIVLLVGNRSSGAGIPISGIAAALIAFGLLAWRAQHR